MDCWEALVDEWCTCSWRAVHENAKDRRSQMVHHNKTEMPHLYDLYGMAHTASYKKAKAFSESDLDDPNNFTNISSHHKIVTYRDTGKATNGDDFNPSQEPLDLELVALQKERLANQAALEKERLAIQAALEKERLASQAALDERDQITARLIEEERARNEAGQRALYELFVGLCEKSGQVPPPMLVFSLIDTIGFTTCMEAGIDGVL
ncbi:hypothetical protein ZWY2020_028811 [Hordeum vulgare]|nr:hypothetical protein ZWY2020_028811 [Hordeum vulgare]